MTHYIVRDTAGKVHICDDEDGALVVAINGLRVAFLRPISESELAEVRQLPVGNQRQAAIQQLGAGCVGSYPGCY